MTASRLMREMSMAEILEWIEYDQCAFDPAWARNAMLLAKIDAVAWKKGMPRPDVARYLPKVKKPRKKPGKPDVAATRLRLDMGLGLLSLQSFGLAPPPKAGEPT